MSVFPLATVADIAPPFPLTHEQEENVMPESVRSEERDVSWNTAPSPDSLLMEENVVLVALTDPPERQMRGLSSVAFTAVIVSDEMLMLLRVSVPDVTLNRECPCESVELIVIVKDLNVTPEEMVKGVQEESVEVISNVTEL